MSAVNNTRANPVTTICCALICVAVIGCYPNQPIATTTCTHAVAYQGAPVRAPVTASLIGPDISERSGLTPFKTVSLDRAFDTAFTASGAVSMTAAVWQEGGDTWERDKGGQPGKLHYWASVGKLLTSATILRLEADGRLSLEDPVSKFVSDVPNGHLITLRMLLTHTSGLTDVNQDPRSVQSGNDVSLNEEIAALKSRGPTSCPGARWQYANVGYALLGGVIETVTRRPYHVAITELVLSRSSAKDLRMISPDDRLQDMVPLAARQYSPSFDVRSPQAAGGLIANASSIAQFYQDLLSGRIVPHAQVQQMFASLYPMDDPGLWYGLGAMAYDVSEPGKDALWLGHSGGVPGARAIVAFVPSQSTIVAVALAGKGSAEASANLLLTALVDAE